MILVDYPNRRRLKIFARIEVYQVQDAPETIAKLENPDYRAKVERAMILHVEAFDWNCPQHITPRYTLEEIHAGTENLRTKIKELEAEIERLKNAK